MKKALCISIVIVIFFSLISAFLYFRKDECNEFTVGDDEIALYIQLNTKEDIGLLVFDYSVNDSEQSGGISNADKSLLKHDELLIHVWNKEELNCSADTAELSVQFRIITEYVDPNFENIYPENITKILDKISFEARFDESYSFTIIGDNINGYKLIRN